MADVLEDESRIVPAAFLKVWFCSANVRLSGDGGNRTHVRDSVMMASTSVAGALISSLARLAGGVAGDQSP
jgi:hypothetical protein